VENREEVECMISQMDRSIDQKGLFTELDPSLKKPSRKKKKMKKPKGTNVSMDSKSKSTILIAKSAKKKRSNTPDWKSRPICVNRLTGLSDKKGKTRVVCIANIILQSFLKPVHEHLFHLL
jgi:hypothetical protein